MGSCEGTLLSTADNVGAPEGFADSIGVGMLDGDDVEFSDGTSDGTSVLFRSLGDGQLEGANQSVALVLLAGLQKKMFS